MTSSATRRGSRLRRPRHPRFGLTARLALVGIASALVPFVVGALILLAVPDRVANRQVDEELRGAADRAGAQLQLRRADLAFALARVSGEQLARPAAAGDRATVARMLTGSWRAARLPQVPDLDVQLRGSSPERAVDGAVAAYLTVHSGARSIGISAREPGADLRILRAVARAADVALTLETLDHRAVVAVDDDGAVVQHADSTAAARAQSTAVGAGPLLVTASVDGGPLQLLLRAHGREVRVALVLLLAAGMLCAIAVALMMDRMLGNVATTAQRMSSGDFETRLPVVGADAGARVAASLNELAGELQARIGTLEQTVDRLDRTLAAIDDGVCTWSDDGVLQTWNASAASITGVSEDAARHGSATAELLRAERSPGRRRVMLPIGDGDRHLAVELVARRMQDGGILQVFRDAAPALSIEQARKNFLVTAAHELRTPLVSVLGFARTIADEDLELSEDVRRLAVEQIIENANRLDGVVDALFESSMLAQDKVDVAVARVPVVAAMWAALDAVGVEDVDVGGVQSDAVVRADTDALVRVLGSLLDNADKYGARPITVATTTVDERVRIAVSDAGPGIPDELGDAVFEPFFRLDPEMRTDVGGAGMGLYSARRLVEAMGGVLGVAAGGPSGATGRGSTFTIVLPSWPAVSPSERTDALEPDAAAVDSV